MEACSRSPRLNADGSKLAWLEWNHPKMPWIGCELWVAEFASDGSVARKRLVAGDDDESIFQPEWSPDGRLYFVSDRGQASLSERWWNLFRVSGDVLDGTTQLEPVYPLAAEFGRPQWQFRMSTFAFTSDKELICRQIESPGRSFHSWTNRILASDGGALSVSAPEVWSSTKL